MVVARNWLHIIRLHLQPANEAGAVPTVFQPGGIPIRWLDLGAGRHEPYRRWLPHWYSLDINLSLLLPY